jgi:hypothetical protein
LKKTSDVKNKEKKMKKLLILCILFSSINGYAVTINDVEQRDIAYPSIQKSVEKGYMSLYSGDNFKGDKPLSRKEMAIVLDRVLKDIDIENLNLSKAELQELVHLAKTFKTYLSEHDVKVKKLGQKLEGLETEQKTLNKDITKYEDKLKQMKKQNDDQHFYMMIGIALAGILGVLI